MSGTKVTGVSLRQAFQMFLVASYAYYLRHVSLMSDESYDKIAKALLTNWDTFEHQHKYLVTKEDLQAGTLYALKAKDYPLIIRTCAELRIRKHEAAQQRKKYGHDAKPDHSAATDST